MLETLGLATDARHAYSVTGRGRMFAGAGSYTKTRRISLKSKDKKKYKERESETTLGNGLDMRRNCLHFIKIRRPICVVNRSFYRTHRQWLAEEAISSTIAGNTRQVSLVKPREGYVPGFKVAVSSTSSTMPFCGVQTCYLASSRNTQLWSLGPRTVQPSRIWHFAQGHDGMSNAHSSRW